MARTKEKTYIKKARTPKEKMLRVLLYVSVLVVILITLYPYFAMFTTALKSRAEIYAMKGTILPIDWAWENFTENYQRYIDYAVEKRENTYKYDIVKRM